MTRDPQILVLAKEPAPGRVKTRLCPPCTFDQAAAIARAALLDTLDAVSRTPARQRTLVLDGAFPLPPGWCEVPQRGTDLPDRLAAAFADTAVPGAATVLIGMDTPQVTPGLLASAGMALADADAALGLADDGGWWALALREPGHAQLLRSVPTSACDTGARTLAALTCAGLRVAALPKLRDVDTAEDAQAVARQIPERRFAAAVRDMLA
jgi:glycosyltransferase A (GT-A) superfamily protein (DUF2064 family)